MSDGVDDSLPQCARRQLEPFRSALCVGNEGGVELCLKVTHHILVDTVEVSPELPAIENMGLGTATEDCTDHTGQDGEAGNIVRQQPGLPAWVIFESLTR